MKRSANIPVLAVATLSLLTMITGCSKLQARDQLIKGVQAYKNAKFEEAIDHFQNAERLDPSLENAPLYLATANFSGKFKTPYQYVVSAVRAADIEVKNVRPLLATLTRLGMPLYGCQSPDGYKNTEDVWLNPDALAQRISFATALGLGRIPLGKVIDDGTANDPYARNAIESAADPAADRAGSDVGTPLDSTALLATLGDKISPEARTRIAAADPPTLRAALVLGGPDFMRH
jgi:Protein of unknown function (DUF1800)